MMLLLDVDVHGIYRPKSSLTSFYRTLAADHREDVDRLSRCFQTGLLKRFLRWNRSKLEDKKARFLQLQYQDSIPNRKEELFDQLDESFTDHETGHLLNLSQYICASADTLQLTDCEVRAAKGIQYYLSGDKFMAGRTLEPIPSGCSDLKPGLLAHILHIRASTKVEEGRFCESVDDALNSVYQAESTRRTKLAASTRQMAISSLAEIVCRANSKTGFRQSAGSSSELLDAIASSIQSPSLYSLTHILKQAVKCTDIDLVRSEAAPLLAARIRDLEPRLARENERLEAYSLLIMSRAFSTPSILGEPLCEYLGKIADAHKAPSFRLRVQHREALRVNQLDDSLVPHWKKMLERRKRKALLPGGVADGIRGIISTPLSIQLNNGNLMREACTRAVNNLETTLYRRDQLRVLLQELRSLLEKEKLSPDMWLIQLAAEQSWPGWAISSLPKLCFEDRHILPSGEMKHVLWNPAAVAMESIAPHVKHGREYLDGRLREIIIPSHYSDTAKTITSVVEMARLRSPYRSESSCIASARDALIRLGMSIKLTQPALAKSIQDAVRKMSQLPIK